MIVLSSEETFYPHLFSLVRIFHSGSTGMRTVQGIFVPLLKRSNHLAVSQVLECSFF